jgi:hypothetical protein
VRYPFVNNCCTELRRPHGDRDSNLLICYSYNTLNKALFRRVATSACRALLLAEHDCAESWSVPDRE